MIEHIEPTAGPPGTRVRIVGRGFQRSYRVLFNEHPVTPVEVLPERITVVVPDGAQTGRWVLSNGSDEVETRDLFRVTAADPAPVVRSVEPAATAPGAEVVLRGQNFAARPLDNTVRIGNLPMVVRSGDTTSLRVIVPDGARTGPVFVRTGGGEARSAGDLTVSDRLVVREFVPAAVAPGGRVTLRGTGFSTTLASNRVTLNGRPVRALRASATEMEIEVPVDAQGGTIAVSVQGVGRYETAQRLFVGAAPVIREMVPPRGRAGRAGGAPRDAVRQRRHARAGDRRRTPRHVVSVAPQEVVVTVPADAQTGRVADHRQRRRARRELGRPHRARPRDRHPRRAADGRRRRPGDPHRHRLLHRRQRERRHPRRAGRARDVSRAHLARRAGPPRRSLGPVERHRQRQRPGSRARPVHDHAAPAHPRGGARVEASPARA